MSPRAFRFGVVAIPGDGGEDWAGLARRVEGLGYSTLLMPDVATRPDPFIALGVAAGATSTLRVGTYVAAGPLRTPAQVARCAHSLAQLSGDRFEFGIGTGRPDAEPGAVRLGMSHGSAEQRLADVATAIECLRSLDGARDIPILMTAGSPGSRALAAKTADIITLVVDPLATRAHVGADAAELMAAAKEHGRFPELAMNVFVVGDEVPDRLRRHVRTDAATLIAHDSLTMLRGGPDDIADELQRRRDAFGVSYITIHATFAELFAPVVERLRGRSGEE